MVWLTVLLMGCSAKRGMINSSIVESVFSSTYSFLRLVHNPGVYGDRGLVAGGGAVRVGDGLLLTMNHVYEALATGVGLEGIEGKLVARSIDYDLALLRAASAKGSSISLAAREPEVGERVWMVYYYNGILVVRPMTVARPLGERLLVWYKAFSLKLKDATLFLAGWSHPGTSGASVVNERGELVGLVYGFTSSAVVTFAVNVTTIRKFLEGAGVG